MTSEHQQPKDCCPYCGKQMRWEQWKETWFCDDHGRFGTDEAKESRPHPAPAPTFSEEECEYLEELILDNIEQYPDSGSFTPEKRDALYQKIAFKMQAGEPK